MSDLTNRLQIALDKAAEFELIGSLAADPLKRAEYRTPGGISVQHRA